MAEDYDAKRYNARIWTDHFRGWIPGGPFDPKGDVVALKIEEVKDVPALKGKIGLYAQIAPLPDLIQMANEKKKVFFSIEIFRNFARTGRAYMTGLAVTDEPASQGTEMLAFSAAGAEAFCGPSVEVELEFHEDGKEEQETPSLFTRIKEMFAKKTGTDAEKFSDIDAAVMEVAASQQQALDAFTTLQKEHTEGQQQFTALQTAHASLLQQFNELKEAIEKAPAGQYTKRPDATGDEGGETRQVGF
jgi:hypothetical protein